MSIQVDRGHRDKQHVMGRRGSGGDQDAATGTIAIFAWLRSFKQDIHLDEGGAITYRTKLQLSFKYEREH